MSSQVFVRAALAADVDAIRDLLAPEVEAGTILPRVVRPDDFLVALLDGEIVAAVAMTRWTDDVVELGSLVSARPGLGLGRAMVQAVLKKAALDLGFAAVVVEVRDRIEIESVGVGAPREYEDATAIVLGRL